MDAMTRRAFDLMLGASGMTKSGVDAKRAVIALRAAGEDRDEVMQMILAKRLSWLNYLTLTQRRWQREPRHMRQRTIRAYAFRAGGIERAPARVQETIDTRERYVRCHA